jgi:hypothetical protein
MYNVNILDAIRIYNSRKDFILFNIDKDLNISQFRLTNDLSTFRNHYDQFRLIEVIKKEIKSGIKIK